MHASSSSFAFKSIFLEDMKNENKPLNTDLPYILYSNFNNSTASSLFPSKLKFADVSEQLNNITFFNKM